jgi:hypothetical protein
VWKYQTYVLAPCRHARKGLGEPLPRYAGLRRVMNFCRGLDETQRETGSRLAGTRAEELLANATAVARELITVLGVTPRALDIDQPTDKSSTRH